jgi:hypothetical protein
MMRLTKQIVVKAVALAAVAGAVVSVGWKGNGPLGALAHYGCNTLDFNAPDYAPRFSSSLASEETVSPVLLRSVPGVRVVIIGRCPIKE